MDSGTITPHPFSDNATPRKMQQKGHFGIVRTKRKLQQETPPRVPRQTASETSFESNHVAKIQPIRKKKGKRETGGHMILRHLQLDSSLLTNSSTDSQLASPSSHSDSYVKSPEEVKSPPPKDFIDELIQKYSGQGQINFADMANRIKPVKPVEVFWEKKHGFGYIPSAREGATLNVVNRKFYLFGGESRSLFNDVMVLNPETWKWEAPGVPSSGDPPPEPRSGHSTVSYKNCLIVFGGGGSFNPMLKLRKCFNRIHAYDTAPYGNTPQVRRNHAAALVGNTMIVYGGVDEQGNPLDDLVALNLDTMRWFSPRIHKSCTVRPGKRHSMCMVPAYSYGLLKLFNFDIFHIPNAYDDTYSKNTAGIYMFGGVTKNGQASNDLYVLKPKQIDYKDDDYYLKWVQPEVSGTPPDPRFAYSAAVRGKYIVFFGGRNNAFHDGGLAVKSIALLNVESMRWETVVSHGVVPAGRWGSCVAAFHTKMVVFGGMRIDKYCSGNLIIAETDRALVKEKTAELKYIQGIREQMGKNAFERVSKATLVAKRSSSNRVLMEAGQSLVNLHSLPLIPEKD